jgi:hypothetical protein
MDIARRLFCLAPLFADRLYFTHHTSQMKTKVTAATNASDVKQNAANNDLSQ